MVFEKTKRTPLWLDEDFEQWLNALTTHVNRQIPSNRKVSRREVSKALPHMMRSMRKNVKVQIVVVQGKRRDTGKLLFG